jgi:thiamine-monophosphate kinase
MSEFTFIQKIRERAAQHSSEAILGIGDDTAILPERAGRERLITADLLIEDVHFKLNYTPMHCLAHKALAVSLSDIAAMGGKPEFSLLTLGIPKSLLALNWDEFFASYFALAEKFGVTLIGGDTSSSPDKLVIDSIVMGSCESGKAIRRSTAKIGDAIFVTGTLGASTAGLQLLLKDEVEKNNSITAHLMPQPRVEFGIAAGASSMVHSMMDVSDGLAQDLSHLCAESNVSAVLHAEAIPVAPNANFEQALSGGEDYELLFTANHIDEDALQKFAQTCGLRLTCIGEIIKQTTDPVFLNRAENIQPLKTKGFDHFNVA